MLKPTAIRYIKLGEKGRWEKVSLVRGELHFGYCAVPHELALAGDRAAIRALRIEQGKNAQAAADDTRQILDFYQQGTDCLWFTFAHQHLWWTFAEPEVKWLGSPTDEHGCRMRRSLDGWRNQDIKGHPLRIDNLSSHLTQTAAYRRTICSIEHEDHFLRRINAIEPPVLALARKASNRLTEITAEAIGTLHWADFETLVDVMFARSGWHRASVLGKNKKDIDLELEHPAMNARAFVQVKSSANQAVLDDYIARFREAGIFHHMFFISHAARSELISPDPRSIHVWQGRELARNVVRLGLHEWVFAKVA